MHTAILFDDSRVGTTGTYCLRGIEGIVDRVYFDPHQIAKVDFSGFDLVICEDDGSQITNYIWDETGNRIKNEKDGDLTRFEYDVANQLTVQINASGRTTYTFDANGNQHIVEAPNNDLTTTTWNYENQPTLYEKPTNALVTMTYNPDNRRVCKESAAAKSNFIWDVESDNVLIETDDFDVTQVTYTNEPATFGSLVSQRRSSATNWFCFDALGSTWNLTNSSETITDSYLYDAWGNIITSTGSTTNPFRWTGNVGYYYDTELETYYIRARTYQPTIGRWLSADPLGFIDGLNLYLAYFAPNGIDPSGFAARAKHIIRDHKGCCLASGMKLICRTMPAAFHVKSLTHCYIAFSNATGKYIETISGQRDGKTGKAVLSDSFWDRDYANKITHATQHEHPIALPLVFKDLCSLYDCLYREASAINGTFTYNQYYRNSNTFLSRVIEKCGVMANFPASAVASSDNGTGSSCMRTCIGPGKNIVSATASEIARCQKICKTFNSSTSKPF